MADDPNVTQMDPWSMTPEQATAALTAMDHAINPGPRSEVLLSSMAFGPRHSGGDLVTGLAFKERRPIGPN